MKLYSTTDITASYFHIPIREEVQKYTGFKYNNNTMVWCWIPFGMLNAGAVLIRAAMNVIKIT